MAASSSSSSSSSSSALKTKPLVEAHRIEGLYIVQNCGPISVHQKEEPTANGEQQVTFIAKEDIVVYFDESKRSLTVYGLGSCDHFQFHGKTERRYIENSKVGGSASGIATENGRRRTDFYGPDKAISMLNIHLQLMKLHISGNSTLTSINPECINETCSMRTFFNIELKGKAELKCPLKATLVDFRLFGESSISTHTIREGQSLLWSLDKARFTIDTCKWVEGINVSGVLQLIVMKKRPTLRFNVQHPPSCRYIATSGLTINKRFNSLDQDSVHELEVGDIGVSLNDIYDDQLSFEERLNDYVRYSNGTIGFMQRSAHSSSSYSQLHEEERGASFSTSGENDEDTEEAIRQSIIETNTRREIENKAKRRRISKNGLPFTVTGNLNAKDYLFRPGLIGFKHCNICMENVALVTLDCGHLTHCRSCFYKSCHKETDSKGRLLCNMCRNVVRSVTIAYIDLDEPAKEKEVEKPN